MKRLAISKEAVCQNIRLLQKKAGKAEIYAVLKSNGYGYGLNPLAKIVSENGIHRFAVTEPKDALKLRNWGFEDEEILIIRSTCDEDDLKDILDASATASIGSYDDAVILNKLADERDMSCDVHIKINSGLGRYGFEPNETERIISVFRSMPRLNVTGMFSHYADANNKAYSQKQLDSFLDVVTKVRDAGFDPGIIHIDASASLCSENTRILDAVRAGSALTGNNPIVKASGFISVATYETKISEMRWIPKGQPIGYGSAFVSKKPMKIAFIPIGFYDGFAVGRKDDVFTFRAKCGRLLKAFTSLFKKEAIYVTVNGTKTKVLGHIGMNHCTIDVTDIDCKVGTTVVLPATPFYANADVPRDYV